MKTITFNSGFRLDDPNNHWGDPSYHLETGDPGYVPPSPTNQPPQRRNHMKRNSYFPSRTNDQVNWLVNWINKLPGYGATVGLSPAQITATTGDAGWLVYVLQSWLGATRTWAEACTNAVTEAQSGTGMAPMTLPVFTAPALPAGVAPVNPGALTRIFAVVQAIKPACTDVIASNLGIVGSEKSAPDWNTFAPVLKITRAPAGVTVGWDWQGKAEFIDQIEIQVNRGNAWQLLTYDTTPGYVDTEAIPAAPTKWEYRAIYRLEDQRIGQWSAAASVIVGG